MKIKNGYLYSLLVYWLRPLLTDLIKLLCLCSTIMSDSSYMTSAGEKKRWLSEFNHSLKFCESLTALRLLVSFLCSFTQLKYSCIWQYWRRHKGRDTAEEQSYGMGWDNNRGGVKAKSSPAPHWVKTSWCRSSRMRVKLLIGPIALSVMEASCPQSKLGPNTTARLALVILLTSLSADTCTSITIKITNTNGESRKQILSKID